MEYNGIKPEALWLLAENRFQKPDFSLQLTGSAFSVASSGGYFADLFCVNNYDSESFGFYLQLRAPGAKIC